MKLFHTADLHLGRRRLDGRLPDKDLADAFGFVASQAIEEKADVFLITGDFFDRPQVEPPHLRQAQRVLARLKEARIPVLAIEGNHDKAFIHSEEPTWVQYLAEDELLILLRTAFDASGPLLAPWDSARKCGAWIEVGGVRFVGAGYLGAATPHKLREIAARLKPDPVHVLMLHAGPDYFVGEAGGFSTEDLRALNDKVCYLALGHIHKPMRRGGWACNPGSPENCDVREAAYDRDSDGNLVPRGYAVVEIDAARRQEPVSLEVRSNPRRPCRRLELDCSPFGNKLKEGAAALVKAATKLIREKNASRESVIDLRLSGKLNLNRIALDQAVACAEIEQAAGVCAVSLDTTGLNVEGLALGGGAGAETYSREDLEKRAIRQLASGRPLWGLEDREADFAALFYELKESVRAGKSEEELAEQLSQSSLVELIRSSRQAARQAAATATPANAPPEASA